MSCPSPSTRTTSQRLAAGATAGLVGGLGAALLDAALAVRALGPGADAASIMLWALAAVGGAGALLGLVAVGAVLLGELAAVRIGRGARYSPAAALTALGAPICAFVAVRLFEGGTMSRLPGRGVLKALMAVALMAVFFASSRAVLLLVRRAEEDAWRPARRNAVAALLVLVSIAAFFLDAELYRRLYIYLHGVLGAVAVAAAALAFRVAAFRRTAWAPGRKVLIAAFAFAVIGLGTTTGLVGGRDALRAAILEHTAVFADLLHVTGRLRSAKAAARPSRAAVAARAERERRVRAASASDWPSFLDAHLLVVSVDALRADRVGAIAKGKRDLTPGIDRWIRREATLFERAYCTAPHSSYSITSLHTARYVHDEAHLGRELAYPTIAEVLGRAGYETAGYFTQGIFYTEGEKVGHFRRSGFGFGKTYSGAPAPKELTDSAVDAMNSVVDRGEPPSFFWVHYFNVHEPYRSTRFGASPKDRYDGEVATVDPEVARLVAHAEAAFSRGVVVVFLADHGEEFKDHGGDYHGSSLYDEQVRVPLAIRVPGGKAGRVRRPVSIIGLAPTLIRLLGLEPPVSMLGEDLRPAIFGGDAARVDQPVFAAVMSAHMVLSWPWKLIADPSLGRTELYDLGADPAEKVNLADRRPGIAAGLRDELHAFLDDIGRGGDEAETALNLGQMRDPRAAPGLVRVALNDGAPTEDRVAAVELLGNLGDKSVVPRLVELLGAADEEVAIAAAVGLGELGDKRGVELLHDALYADDPGVRDRAALVLGRMGDAAAVPALVEALGRDDVTVREEATRMLGRIGDKGAVDALIAALDEERTQYLTVLALGKIGDPRAYGPLMGMLDTSRLADVRGYTVVALGWLGMQAAIPRLLKALVDEPDIKWTTESLVRLGAVGKAPLFGTDAARGLAALKEGFGRCEDKPRVLHSEYLERTYCRTTGPRAELSFFADAPEGAVVILRARHALPDKAARPELAVIADGTQVGAVRLGAGFEETRLPIPAGAFPAGEHSVVLKLDRQGFFELDHLLVLGTKP